MPNLTGKSLVELRAMPKADIIVAMVEGLKTFSKKELVEFELDATEFPDVTVTQGEHGILIQTQTVRDALGDVLRVERMEWTYYPTGEVDEITHIVKNAAGDEIDDSVIKHYIGPQPQGRFVLTVVLASQDVSGVTAPIPANYWKLVDVGERDTLWCVDAPASVLLDLHRELWAMTPAGTFGVLAVASARGNWFLPAAVRHHAGMSGAEALARRDRIVSYLKSLGFNTSQLEVATDEALQMAGIVVALGHTMAQLWRVMGR